MAKNTRLSFHVSCLTVGIGQLKTLRRFVLAMCVVIVFAEISSAEEFNFRKTRWGMSQAQVKSSESLESAKEDPNFLGYRTSVIGKNVFMAYYFINNQLVRTRYILAEEHSNKNDYISDYNAFKDILTKKYGQPSDEQTFWKNDLYKDDYSDWGMAISVGHLAYFSSWETQDTEIDSMLAGENFRINCIVEYCSKELKDIEKKAEEKKALESF